MSSSPIQTQNPLSASYGYENDVGQQQRKEGLTTRLRQTINAAGKRIQRQNSDPRRPSQPDLSHLTPQSQELILRAVDSIRKEDSESVINTMNTSRDILRNSFEEFKREQDEYRKQLEDITRNKEAAMERRNENVIPISRLMRQKQNPDVNADLRPNSGMNPTYQAYFEALLTTDQNEQQHSTDKAAVAKYIRRRERRKRAEENRKKNQLTEDVLEKQTAELMGKMEGMDIKLENERQRQNDILRARMNEKKTKTNIISQANEIIDQANEADLARQRVEQTQREKIEARLSAARHQQNRNPTNMIHIKSRLDENGDELDTKLDDEQMATTKNSLQLLNHNENNRPMRSKTPIYGDDDANDNVPNIHI